MTPLQLRETLRDVDLDRSKGVSFIELLLWKYKKTVDDLLAEVEHPLPADLAEKLTADIAVYQTVQEAERKRTEKIQSLTLLAEGGGAKGLAAKAELEQLRNEDTLARNKARVEADKRRRSSASLLENWEKDSAAQHAARLAAEAGRVEADKKAVEDARRAESKKNLAQKSALWK